MTTLAELWTTVTDFWQANAEPIILGTGATLTLLIAFLLYRFIRTANRSKVVSTLAAVVVMAWTSEGLLAAAVREFKVPVAFAAVTFFVFEAMMLAAALHAEETRKRKGAPGQAGPYVFVIALASGVIAAFGAHNIGEVVLRIILPPLSVGLWWIFLVAERPDDKPEWIEARKRPEAEEESSWTITPRRVLVWLRLKKPGYVTITEAQRQRQVARVAKLAYAVFSWPAWTPPHQWARWRLGRIGGPLDDAMVNEAAARADRAANIVTLVVPTRRPVTTPAIETDTEPVTETPETAITEDTVADTEPVTGDRPAADPVTAEMTAAADVDDRQMSAPEEDAMSAETDVDTDADDRPVTAEVAIPTVTLKPFGRPEVAVRVAKLLNKDPHITAAQVASRLAMSPRTARRYLSDLRPSNGRSGPDGAGDDKERLLRPVNGHDHQLVTV